MSASVLISMLKSTPEQVLDIANAVETGNWQSPLNRPPRKIGEDTVYAVEVEQPNRPPLIFLDFCEVDLPAPPTLEILGECLAALTFGDTPEIQSTVFQKLVHLASRPGLINVNAARDCLQMLLRAQTYFNAFGFGISSLHHPLSTQAHNRECSMNSALDDKDWDYVQKEFYRNMFVIVLEDHRLPNG